MNKWQYLLIPFAPLIATICLFVFAFERKQAGKSGNHFHSVEHTSYIWDWIFYLSLCPVFFLGEGGRRIFVILINAPITHTLGLWIPVRQFVRDSLWYPLFCDIVPAYYFSWNSCVYDDLQQSSQQIRVLKLHPGLWSAELEAELVTGDITANERHYEAL